MPTLYSIFSQLAQLFSRTKFQLAVAFLAAKVALSGAFRSGVPE
jgi:hypothetical protein